LSEKPEEPIHQRINLLINTLEEGVQRRFAQTIGVASGVVGDMLGQRKSKPGFDLISKILQAYPQIRAEWLLLGQGEMLKSAEVPKKSALHSKAAAGTEPRIVAIAEGNNTAAPLYNIRTAANYLGTGLSQERPEPDGIISLPAWLLRRGDYAVFPVIGESMEPTFYARDYVLCRFLPKTEWEYLREDVVAVIVSESRGLQLKRLTFRLGEGYVRCKSDNRHHPYYQLDLEDVLEVWHFEWRITSNAHNPTEGLAERVSTLEYNLEDMRALLEQVLDTRELNRIENTRKNS
jgi:phage repressor protein C with HTH and peptisase S24 domain